MRKIIFSFWGICCTILLQAQDPVQWNFSSKKIDDKTYEVHLTASIKSPWSIYSQSTPADGPFPTSFSFNNNPLVELRDKVNETGNMKKKHEPVFDVDVYYYKDKVDFVQTIKLKAKVKTNLSGTLEYMACNEEQCLPPKTIPFSIPLP